MAALEAEPSFRGLLALTTSPLEAVLEQIWRRLKNAEIAARDAKDAAGKFGSRISALEDKLEKRDKEIEDLKRSE